MVLLPHTKCSVYCYMFNSFLSVRLHRQYSKLCFQAKLPYVSLNRLFEGSVMNSMLLLYIGILIFPICMIWNKSLTHVITISFVFWHPIVSVDIWVFAFIQNTYNTMFRKWHGMLKVYTKHHVKLHSFFFAKFWNEENG